MVAGALSDSVLYLADSAQSGCPVAGPYRALSTAQLLGHVVSEESLTGPWALGMISASDTQRPQRGDMSVDCPHDPGKENAYPNQADEEPWKPWGWIRSYLTDQAPLNRTHF